MSLLADLPAALTNNAVTWSRVDAGFYVASRAGEFVGSVDTTADGHFIGFDGTSAPIGRYPSLIEAKTAVLEWKPAEKRAQERRLSRMLMPVATLAGAVAGVFAVSGVLLTALPI